MLFSFDPNSALKSGKLFTFPFKTSGSSHGFKASNPQANFRGLTYRDNIWWLPLVHPSQNRALPYPLRLSFTELVPDFNWAVAWPALCKPNWSLRQGIYCQYHILMVWVWMPLTCAACKHHQAESESLQVLTVWNSLAKVHRRVLCID